MDISEFSTKTWYLKQLKEEKTSKETDTIKSKDFYKIMHPWILRSESYLWYRDYLDTDKTFSIVMPKDQAISLKDGVGLYLDTCDILKDVTYSKIKNTGFIDIPGFDSILTGFWVLVG